MSDKLFSLQKQLAEYEASLDLIGERKSEYVQQTEISLDLIRAEKTLEKKIADLRAQILSLQQATTALRHRRPIPPLLPYLADRNAQKYVFGETLKQRHERPTRPILCIIYGDEFQSHEMFQERLVRNWLPQLL